MKIQKKGFRKGFTLVEMMIVVAIIAILAGVAIPTYTKYVRKSEAIEAIGFLKQIIDAESSYKSSHGKFFIKPNDINKTMQVLNIDAPGGTFEYNMKAGDTTVLVRANKKNETDYIYMFYPPNNSAKIKGYVDGEWDNSAYMLDYINKTTTDIDLQSDGTAVATY